MNQVPALQTAVDRYSNALAVPTMLEKLHPRKQGNPGNAGALAPAIVLTSISAYEGFAEEFLAILAAHRGQNYAQVAKFVTMNNPTVATFESKLKQLLQWPANQNWEKQFSMSVWDPPREGASTWITQRTLSWNETKDQAEGWMQVRHCLSHGLVRGYRPEIWPGPLKGTVQASGVLRPQKNGKHSLSLHGAESCAHIYRLAAQQLSDAAVGYAALASLNWSNCPDFAL
ncbi:hypothetical protein [Antrihabitans cavernicola]|uniref:RiboL-PSP-HEPN domain-containing protein n=1 Tax=Antrihabitans cavernicola TaxID=2495913 RepID=A0A5A7S8N2_9NOCA|nr:hypothetical protein [Spelaeibacter cavernicola]KAA0021559.1 hypothetical protein FOY51_18605 [Spelaeibacter cavernicola]